MSDTGYRERLVKVHEAAIEMARRREADNFEFAEMWADMLTSPIEKLFCVAWMTHLRQFEPYDCYGLRSSICILGSFKGGKLEPFPENPWMPQREDASHLDFLLAQKSIGPYRADFVVHRVLRFANEEGQTVYRSPIVVVECDGHEFHERTKEQAQHDRERDRYMQGLGYAVLRFTGTEIWRDPMRAAAQLELFLQQRMCEQLGMKAPKTWGDVSEMAD